MKRDDLARLIEEALRSVEGPLTEDQGLNIAMDVLKDRPEGQDFIKWWESNGSAYLARIRNA